MAATIRKLTIRDRSRRNYMRNQPKKASAVAKCLCKAHTGNLSVKMMKTHNCLSKCGHEACPFLEKLDHPYWEARRLRKEAKKQGKVTA